MMLPTILTDVSLRPYNSFGFPARTALYAAIRHAEELRALSHDVRLAAQPRLILGGGSNLVLANDFPGLVLHMQTCGIERIGETESAVLIRAQAGEAWHDLVRWTLDAGYGGLENMSLIPGSCGAAPVQNIGAYGLELADVLHRLTYWDWHARTFVTLGREECGFSYRDSRFKRDLADTAIIAEIVLALPKRWQPQLNYPDVLREIEAMGVADPTPADIGAAVCAIRKRKLPDPQQLGNAGSFFQNPIVSGSVGKNLLENHPQMPYYPQADGAIKLAAGWLIEAAGWKGRRMGNVGVYEKQALVLVNHGGAHGYEIATLASAIRQDVWQRFGVILVPEPVFV